MMSSRRRLVILALCMFACGCNDKANPVQPARNALAISSTTPASGATVVIPEQFPYIIPGGVAFPPGTGLLAVNITASTANQVPWAQLNVYLLTDGSTTQYCGQNTPDSPTWQFLTPGWQASVTVTGFRVYRLPCDVTGIRAMLHMRNNGLLTPPTPSETIAEATVPTIFHLR